MRRCRLIFLSFILFPGFILTASSCSSFFCYSSLYHFTSSMTTENSKRSEERPRLPSDSEKNIIERLIRGFKCLVDEGEGSFAPPSALDKAKKWDEREITALGNDLVHGAEPQSSIDFYGRKSMIEYESEHHSTYYVDVLKDYLFAVLYSGVVVITFMGILGRMTLSPLFHQ